jgi:APA family basic amino acid/polyamine antiporter
VPHSLDRRLGLIGSVGVGVSAMIGAGLFTVFAPAVGAAGDGVLLALLIAAVVAGCNAMSSALLARRYPVAGGTYVYGRERLGPFWGHLAGWSFVAGKLASCAAMALAIGAYAWPAHDRLVAVLVVALLTTVNLAGVEKSAAVGIALVSVVLAVVAIALVTMTTAPAAPERGDPATTRGVLEGAGLLFFAFAGYARLATLGEEVRRPERTIPRAIAVAVAIVVTVYVASIAALLHAVGAGRLPTTERPFVAGVEAAGADRFVPVVVLAAGLAAGGALLSVLLGVSRTALAMARDGHLPSLLTAVGATRRVPWAAEIVAGAVIVVLVLTGDLVSSIGFSSFCVLVYYAVANASALTLPSGRLVRAGSALGLTGCVVLAALLPAGSVVAGALVVACGAVAYLTRRRGGTARQT